nr:H-NS histone family protein [uncultured Albidiferax sp.]
MARSLAVIQQQIAKLQKEAEVLKKKDVPGVIERIKTAIEFYGLTPADLFEPAAGATSQAQAKAAKVKSPKNSAKKKERIAPVIKFQDGAGNSWTGHGKRPGWFKAAIDAGKTADDLKVVPAAEATV